MCWPWDDDPSVRKMIVDYLADNDMRVTALAGGREIPEVMGREMIDPARPNGEKFELHARHPRRVGRLSAEQLAFLQ